MTRRIFYLDRFRFLVVTFAIMSHVISKHNVMDTVLADTMVYLRLLTRTATPSLLILLGIMVTIVYVPRFLQEPRVAAAKMLNRTLQCYLAFLVIVLVGLLLGIQGVRHSLGAVLFLNQVSNGTIFQLYVLLLPVAIGLLWLQVRLGPLALALLAVMLWVAEPLVVAVVLPERLADIGSVGFGYGGHWGPSAYHGISLVAFGMLVGNAIAPRSSPTVRRQSAVAAAALVVGAAAVLIIETQANGLRFVAGSIVYSGLYRANNELPYFAFGALGAVMLLAVSWVLSRAFSPQAFAIPDRVGRFTLTYFLIGEILILTLPEPTLDRYATLLPTLVFYVGTAGLLTIGAQYIKTNFLESYGSPAPVQVSQREHRPLSRRR